MSEHTSLYGGITYAQNPFAFDRVFNSHSDVTNPNTDGILIGRYILIQYCDIALTQDDRNLIETWANNGSQPIKYNSLPDNVKASWDSYYNNFRKDNLTKILNTVPVTELFSWDRHVLRKKYDQGTKVYSYEDVAQLNSTLSIDGLKIHDTFGGDPILSINSAKQLTTDFDLGYTDKKLQLIGKNNTPFSDIDTAKIVSDHILTTDGYLQWDSTNQAAYIDLSQLSNDPNKIIYMDNEKIKTALTIEYDSDDKSRYYQHIVLKGKDGNVISSFDASNFVKDSFLRSVTCNEKNELVFTFKTYDVTTGEYSEVDQSLSLSVDIMDAGNGIQIDGNVISIKKDASSDEFLSVGPNGLLLTGVSTAIEQAKEEAISTVENRVYKVNSYAELNEITATKNIGDIGIVVTPIAEGKNQYTAYVWQQKIGGTEAHWEAMDGNYNADNVYFTKDLITSFAIGNYTLSNGMATIPAAGKNLNEIWQAIYVKEINTSLQKTQPSCTMSGNSIKYYLVGATSETRTITLGLDKGAYDYGYGYVTSKDETDPATGTPAKTRVTNDGAGVVPVASSPYTLTWDGTIVQPTATNGNVFSCTGRKKTSAPAEASVIGKVKYEKAGNPVSNLGNIYPAQAYSNNTSNANTQVLARWYYPFYQGFTVDSDVISSPGEITGAQLEALNKNNMLTYRFSDDATSVKDSDRPGTTKFIDANAYSKKKVVKAIAQNPWRQYFIAYPKSYGYVMSNAKDGNNIDCTVKQAKDITLTFNGVNVVYSVYYINNATPYGTKTITWTLN